MHDTLPLLGSTPTGASTVEATRGLAFAWLWQNPVAQREWRALAHQARDWRLWMGLRVPKDARGWGLPAVAWFCGVPYALLVALQITAQALPLNLRLSPDEFPDVMALVFLLCSGYTCLMGVALMAPAIARERERETWDALRTSVLTPGELVLGMLLGRLAPVLLAYLAAATTWLVFRPHYSAALQGIAPLRLTWAELVLMVTQTGLLLTAVGSLSLAASAWSRSTGSAILLAIGLFIALAIGTAAAWLLLPAEAAVALVLLVGSVATLAGYVAALRGLRSGEMR